MHIRLKLSVLCLDVEACIVVTYIYYIYIYIYVPFVSTYHNPKWSGSGKNRKCEDPIAKSNDN